MPDHAMNRRFQGRTNEPTETRLDRLSPGAWVVYEDRSVQVVSFERGVTGRLEVLLDTGAGLQRVPIAQFFAVASAGKSTTATEETDPVDSPLLAQLPDDERTRLEIRNQDLLQIRTGSRRGDPDGDRSKGVLSKTYDPDLTTLTQRYEAKAQELKDRGIPASSKSQLYRQMVKVEAGGIEGLIHRSKRMGPRRLDDVDEDILTAVTALLDAQPEGARLANTAMLTTARAALLEADIGHDLSNYKLKIVIGALSKSLDLHHEAKGRERVSMKPDVVYGRRLVSRPGRSSRSTRQQRTSTSGTPAWDGSARRS